MYYLISFYTNYEPCSNVINLVYPFYLNRRLFWFSRHISVEKFLSMKDSVQNWVASSAIFRSFSHNLYIYPLLKYDLIVRY